MLQTGSFLDRVDFCNSEIVAQKRNWQFLPHVLCDEPVEDIEGNVNRGTIRKKGKKTANDAEEINGLMH